MNNFQQSDLFLLKHLNRMNSKTTIVCVIKKREQLEQYSCNKQENHNFIYPMRIELSKDQLFTQHQPLSLGKDMRSKQRQKLRQIKNQKLSLSTDKAELNIQVIDPLPEELRKYKGQIVYKKTHQVSKASNLLKRYILQQERNLKRVRLQKLQTNAVTLNPSRSQLRIDMKTHSNTKSQKNNDEIDIPLIEQLFKNQQQDYVLFESKLMRDQLKRAHNTIDQGVKMVKNYYLQAVPGYAINSGRNTAYEKFPPINPQNRIPFENQFEIDNIIDKKLKMSKKLRDRLYNEKKQMMSNQARQSSSKSKSLNFYIQPPKKPKTKVALEGVKSITLMKGKQKIKVTPASSLLFSLNKMSQGHEQKQEELEQLLQNSYQNRMENLSQKSDFYEQQTPFNDLSPSNQFRLRKLMDKKLLHRLELSRQQINKFCEYLTEIKSYHIIINDEILDILKQVRLNLLSGKLMKIADLTAIIKTKNKNKLVGHPNELILQKLSQMMI